MEESVGGNCDYLLDDDEMIEIFGPKYASNPAEFKFETGDKKLIRELVSRVKEIVDGNGKLTGLAYFEMKKKIKRKKPMISMKKRRPTNRKAAPKTEKSIDDLKSELLRRTKECLELRGINASDLSDETVGVEPNRVTGYIYCSLCPEGSNKKSKSKPKHVYYQWGTRSSYWAMSNFEKHIENSHSSVITKSNDSKKTARGGKASKVKSKCLDSNTDFNDSKTIPSISCSSTTKQNNSVCVIDCDSSIEIVGSDVNIDVPTESNTNMSSYYDQLAAQITQMVGSVLMSGDIQNQMHFQLEKDQVRNISVVPTNADGNCLFSALTHQLFKFPMNSKQHNKQMKTLREDVVKHILLPENFPKFQFNLQDRVYQIKQKSKISDIKSECELYVKNVLSKSGQWGGIETINAVSSMYKTNLAVFNEFGPCYIIKSDSNPFNQTLLIAYRYGQNAAGKRELNHYDSVFDMDPDSIHATAEFLNNKK